MDPKYKLKLIEYYFQKIYGDESFFEIERIRQYCYDLLKEYQHSNGSGDSTSHVNVVSESQDDLSDYDLFISQQKELSNVNVTSELDHYLGEEVLSRVPNFDILSWWKSSGLKYPTLQSIARDVLAIPISTVAS